MTYQQTLDYLYASQPAFHQIGAVAYKPGFDNILKLMQHLGNPHHKLRCVHIAGTNGKGSTSHLIAAVLQAAGYKTALYTSPHLVDFRERIRIGGQMIAQDDVIRFVENNKDFLEQVRPSFFETATALAFDYFVKQKVDIAVIETGLGGRLDSTNIITPLASVITNIGYDHTEFLGSTLQSIAAEKAGIMKPDVPVIIGETNKDTTPVFLLKSKAVGCPITFAEQINDVPDLRCELQGAYQQKNKRTAFAALQLLRQVGLNISPKALTEGFEHVCGLTGLQGRWQVIDNKPDWICDTGHNSHAYQYVAKQLNQLKCNRLFIIFGMVSDKDVEQVFKLLPQRAYYFFTQASTKRAISAAQLLNLGEKYGLQGESLSTVSQACEKAQTAASVDDTVFVGGSNYVVGEFLAWHNNCRKIIQ